MKFLIAILLFTASLHAQKPHWAFQPLSNAPIEADDQESVIDRFVQAKLKDTNLKPNPPADRRTLLRRLSYTLIGLPPTSDEIDAFVKDDAHDAWSKQVERLLASPAYGERWARMWLDVARYADSNGQDENHAMANAWRYRNWTIDAFNRDLPYADFVRHQIAGDLIDDVENETKAAAITATGFLVLGPKRLAEQDKEKMVHDIVDEQIDTLGRAFLGMTFGCARCHDHFFDPVSQADYFALAGIFHSTQTMKDTEHVSKWNERNLSGENHEERVAAYKKSVANNEAAIKTHKKDANQRIVEHIKNHAVQYLTPEPSKDCIPEIHQRWQAALKTAPFKQHERSPEFAQTLRWLAEVKPGSLAAGKIGGAFIARGKDILDVPHRPELEPEKLTLEAWIFRQKKGDSSTRHWIINKNSNEWEKGFYSLGIVGESALAYIAPEGGKSKQIAVEGGKLTVGKWHHIACTYNGESLKLFVDGKKVVNSKKSNRPRQISNGHLRIGGRADGYRTSDHLLIDEARIYNRPLSADELLSRFKQPKSSAPTGLIQEWTFDPTSKAEEEALKHGKLALAAEALFQLPKNPADHWKEVEKAKLKQLIAEQDALKNNPMEPAKMTMAVTAATPRSIKIHDRGNHLTTTGNPIPRGVPTRIAPSLDIVIPVDQSGRLELANWITDAQNPLTARVLVNRIWQAHFGEGLVRSPDNFGPKGESPSHPDLLDWMATSFQKSGGSIKDLHRLILHSKTWQQTSETNTSAMENDPDNHLLWRMPMRQLEVEQLRDSLLYVANILDQEPGESASPRLKNYKYAKNIEEAYISKKRTVYLPVIRDNMYDVFTLFDFPQPSASASERDSSVVPIQALFFMNSSLIKECSEAIANGLQGNDTEKTHQALRQIFQRAASTKELTRAKSWIESGGSWTDFCHALLSANEFIYVD